MRQGIVQKRVQLDTKHHRRRFSLVNLIERNDFAGQDLGQVVARLRFSFDENRSVLTQNSVVLFVGIRKDNDLHRAFLVVQANNSHGIPLSGSQGSQLGDESAYANFFLAGHLMEIRCVTGGKRFELLLITIQRMTAQKESERRLFEAQALFLVPFGQIGKFFEPRRPRYAAGVTEETHLAAFSLSLQPLTVVERSIDERKELRPAGSETSRDSPI